MWSAIISQIDMPGSESQFVSVADTERSRFATHPWSIGGGGAAELKEKIDSTSQMTLASQIRSIGFASFPGTDEAFIAQRSDFVRRGIAEFKVLVVGEVVRDWAIDRREWALSPYDEKLEPLSADPRTSWFRHLWPNRTVLGGTISFGGRTRLEQGDSWWTWYRWVEEKYRTPLSITFAFVATHNHFVLDRGGKVFKQSAPVIKLPEGSTAEDHLALLGLLNSSTACFWMRQSIFNKGGRGEAWEQRYEFDSTKMQNFPLPGGARPVEFGRKLDKLATELAAQLPNSVAAAGVPTRIALDEAQAEAQRIEAQMVAIQEELDWHCLWLYGLTDDPFTVPEGSEAPPLALGERAFEVRLARQIAAGEVETAWFTRFRSTPITEIPTQWPDWYRDLVERRMDLIESDRNVGLVERPENKRRWSRTPWEVLESAALRDWLLDRLEDRSLWFEGDRPTVRSAGQLADRMSTDEDWMSVARLWEGQVDIDVLSVVSRLVADEHVPAQAAARYKPSGLAKRAEWERTWELQRAEDRGENVGRVAVPPKYGQADFISMSFWRQRGKLDVPKERFTSVYGAERDGSAGDATQVIAWAGFDHAQTAQALATLLYNRQSQDGWTGERLLPLIAALDEVLPWVAQWHPEVDPGLGQPLAVFYRGQVDQALASIGATRTTLAEWRPATAARGRKRVTQAADVLPVVPTES